MDEGFFGYEERMCMWEALEDSTIMLCETSKVRELIHSNAAFKDLWIVILESSVRYKLYRENGFLGLQPCSSKTYRDISGHYP